MLLADQRKNKKMSPIYRLIPEKLRDSNDTRMKSTVLLLTLMSNISMGILLVPFLIYGFKDSPIIEEGGIQLFGLCLATYLASFIIFYRFSSLVLAGNIALTAIFITAASTSWLTGGMFSPMLFLLLIPPVFAFILTDIISGAVWTYLSAMAFIVLWALDEFMDGDEYEKFQPMMIIVNPTDLSLLSIIIPVFSLAMIAAIVAMYEAYSIQLNKMLAQERNMLAFKASHDGLTGLANRSEFNSRIHIAVEVAKSTSKSLALIYIDLDGFKPINDTIGHHAGDVVLETISNRLTEIIRGSDTVARLGGDEFAIILQGVENDVQITPILEKILKTLGEDIKIDHATTVCVHGSLGVSYFPSDATDVETLCRHADMAMYLAKKQKNTWRFYKQVPQDNDS